MDDDKKGYGAMNSDSAGVIRLGEDTGKRQELRSQRNAACQKLKLLGILQLAYGVVFLGVSIAQIAVAVQGEVGWPLMNPGPWIMSIMVIVVGVLALMLWKKGDEHKDSEDPPFGLGQHFSRYWMVGHLTNCCLIGWSAGIAFSATGQCANENSSNFKYCVPYKEANIALTATLGSLCILSLVVLIPVYVIYYRNACAFGIKPWGCCGIKNCK